MGGCGFQNQETLNSAIESLLSLSENREEIDDSVVCSGWDEVSCGWKNTKPNARYVVSPERRKRSKEKVQYSPDPYSQLAKVKKLAGMIANSNHVSTTKSKTFRNPGMTKYQNSGILSYDTPCWRFIVNPNTFRYIERPTFLELRSVNDKPTTITHTIILENGGMIRCLELNGRLALYDPAFNFDKRLLDSYIDREEFRLRVCQGPLNFSLEYKPSFLQTRTEENKISVVQTMTMKHTLEPCSSVCEMCRHRTQEVIERSASKNSSNTELKPLVKVTPTQRKVAEDSRLAGKILVHQGKDLNLKSLKVSKKAKECLNSKHGALRLDWLPITRSTIAYPCDTAKVERVSNDKFPASQSQPKAFTFPKGHGPKARKLTLSEAANLVPKTSRLGHAIDKLAKELENKQEKPLSLSEPILPSVSGTKLEVSLSNGCCNL